MPRRALTPTDELYRRAVAYVDRRGDALLRRGGRSGGAWAGKRPFDPTKLYALSSLSAANYYAALGNGGESGALGCTWFALCRIDSMVSTGNPRAVFDRYQGSVGGMTAYFNATASTFQGTVYDGAVALKNTALAPFLPSDIGKILLLAVQLTTTGAFRAFFMRAQQYGADTAVTGYTPSAIRPHLIGNRYESVANLPASGISILAHATARGDLTLAQMQAIYDQTRTAGDIPANISGITWAHRWSLRDVLVLGGVAASDGQVAPASLPDTVTAAPADAMTRQGSPIVRVSDPAIVDGRKTYGAQGAAGVNYLVSTLNAGLVGNAAGFSVTLITRWDLLSSLTKGQLYAQTSGSAQGFALYFLSALTLRFNVYDGAGVAQACNVTLAAPDIGAMLIVTAQHDGTTLRVAINGVERATLPITGYTAQTNNAYVAIGGYPTNHNQLENAAVFDVATTNTSLTAGEVAQLYADFQRTGRIVPISGKHVHRWDITQDVVDNGGPQNGFPAQVLDRIGTDHLTRVGGLQVVNGGGISKFSANNFIRTLAGAGLLGSASGCWFEVLFTKAPLVAADEILMSAYTSGTDGWYLSLTAGGKASFAVRGGSGLIGATTPAVLADGLHHLAGVYDGTVARLYVDGVELVVSAPATLTPSTAPTTFGAYSAGTAPANNQSVHGGSGGNFVPTPAEIAAASSAALAGGKVVGIPGKTSKRWSVADDVIEAGGKVPAIYKERVAGIEHMVLIGSGLQVAQRCERLWSWEAA